MTWIVSDSRLSKSPKFFDLVARLKVEPRDAFWNLHHLWYWCSDHFPDGVLKNVSDVAIAYSAQWQGEPKAFVDALVSSGFLDREDQALKIHDWEQHRPDWCRKRDERSQVTDRVRTKRGQSSDKEEKKESPPDVSLPTPLSSLPPKERKEEKNCAVPAPLPAKPKSSATPHWALLIDHIKRKWEYKKRPHGKFNPTAKDFMQLKAKARVYDAFELMALYDGFIVSADPFYAKGGFAIWVFCGAIDALVDQDGWKQRAETYRAQAFKPTTEVGKKAFAIFNGLINGSIKAPNHISAIRKQELRKDGIVQP